MQQRGELGARVAMLENRPVVFPDERHRDEHMSPRAQDAPDLRDAVRRNLDIVESLVARHEVE
jgi:hypothetical protein